MARIGVIGTGHNAAPMVRFLVKRSHSLTVTERSPAVSAQLAQEFGVQVSDPQGVIDASETVILAVRPHQVDAALAGLSWSGRHAVISVMVGVAEAELRQRCEGVTRFAQTIPLGFLEKGGCPLASFGDSALLADLFEPENPVVPVESEAALNAHFAICAMVPGVLDLMASGARWLGGQTGDAHRAEFYMTKLLSGFLATMPGSLAAERDALATKGTLSLQMTTALRDGQAHETLEAALSAIGERLRA